ncbi:hypothetical protein ACO2Q9_02615 [Variovorax sp. VNK109]|uniref:hypothetical protein n=1 Tax=Variovorax sp. VNK109 TaxID=3400919 RepID=UPI003C1221BE
MTTSLDDRKTFLLESSRLYDAMIRMTTSEVIRRYLAFRIIVNAMAFEDVVGKRSHPRLRQIRNVLLAHKQEDDFFEGYKAADEITNATMAPLLAYMSAETQGTDANYLVPELADPATHKRFSNLMPRVFNVFHEDFLSGFRMINNHLCYTGGSIQEVSAGALPGVFYRYHSSMALFQLGQYVYNNTHTEADLLWTARHAKLDMLLHSQNLADSVFKDGHNPHSIDGLLEVMASEGIGDPSALVTLKSNPKFTTAYAQIRQIRNKLVGHMDKNAALPGLLSALDGMSVQTVHDLVNLVDKAVWGASNTHIALRIRYVSGNQPVTNPQIVDISGLKPSPYF